MRKIITLFALLASMYAAAQSVTGMFVKYSGVLGHHGYLRHDESVTIHQTVDVGNYTWLMRRIQIRDDETGVWNIADTVSEVVITGDYVFFHDFMGLTRFDEDDFDSHSWSIDIQYLDDEGDPVPQLGTTFEGIATRPKAGLVISPLPGTVDEPLIMLSANVWNDDGGPQIKTEVVARYENDDYSWVDVDEYIVEDAGFFYQTIVMPENLLFPGEHCIQIWVQRTDLDYPMDMSDFIVDVAPTWLWPCTYWPGQSTSSGETPSVPELHPFPNPTYGPITVQELDTNEQRLDVYDASSRLVSQVPTFGLTSVTHDFSDLAAGMYTLRQNQRTVRLQKL